MKKNKYLLITSLVLILFCFCMNKNALAKGQIVHTNGDKYVMDKNYDFSKNSKNSLIDENGSDYGLLSIDGDISDKQATNGFTSYYVESGNLFVKYSVNKDYIVESDTVRYACEEKSKRIGDIKLDNDIGTGAVVVQTSTDGQNWITDVYYTDIGRNADYTGEIYSVKDIQQINGCYFRIIVAYETNMKNGKKNGYEKNVEVYSFYLVNSADNAVNFASPNTEPRKELGMVEGRMKNSGYNVKRELEVDDPQFESNKKIGTFYINGYTKEADNSVFLKNVGDRVALWFYLNQDIHSLFGNEDLSIVDEKDGYDQFFRIKNLNMKSGCLIIQHTDYMNVKHVPIVYTNFLEANAKTGADTKVELFEEGDYDVALDYKIEDRSKLIPKVYDYQIKFSFSIRNSNCIVFPFDDNNSELSDGALAPNGFSLDMAKSRYLDLNVQYSEVKKENFRWVEDIRFNGAAKDGESYDNEGIYRFSAKNQYTGEITEKVIYVGSSPIIKALSKTGKTLSELNEKIEMGVIINENGELIYPKVELPPTSLNDENSVPQVITVQVPVSTSNEEVKETHEETSVVQTIDYSELGKSVVSEVENWLQKNVGFFIMVIVLAFASLIFQIVLIIELAFVNRRIRYNVQKRVTVENIDASMTENVSDGEEVEE